MTSAWLKIWLVYFLQNAEALFSGLLAGCLNLDF